MSTSPVLNSQTCANCGSPAQVVMSLGRQGEQLVIARINEKFYVTVDCQFCGKVQQEIDYQSAEK